MSIPISFFFFFFGGGGGGGGNAYLGNATRNPPGFRGYWNLSVLRALGLGFRV